MRRPVFSSGRDFMQIENHPDDEIRLGLLCPAQNWKGICRQASCQRSFGACSLSGKPFAAFCKIPVSHPVTQIQHQMMARDPLLPLN